MCRPASVSPNCLVRDCLVKLWSGAILWGLEARCSLSSETASSLGGSLNGSDLRKRLRLGSNSPCPAMLKKDVILVIGGHVVSLKQALT